MLRVWPEMTGEESERNARELFLSQKPNTEPTGRAYTVMLVRLRRGLAELPAEELEDWKPFVRQLTLDRLEGEGLLLTTEEGFTLVSTCADGEDLFARAGELCRAFPAQGTGLSASVGIFDGGPSSESLRESYRHAVEAARAAEIFGTGVQRYRDLGIYQLLFAVRDPEVLRDFEEETLGPIAIYDEAHKTNLLGILETYIRCGGSVNMAAGELGVHRNTVNYKVKNIRRLFDLQLDSRDITVLTLAFCCRALVRQRGGVSRLEEQMKK